MEDLTRNLLISCICGAVFGLSWWLMIDIIALYPEVSSYKHGLFYLPICLSTFSLFVNGLIPNSSLAEAFVVTKTIFMHRFIFFLSMTLGFAGLISSTIICSLRDASSLPPYALIGVPILNALILLSNVVFKFAIVDENDDLF